MSTPLPARRLALSVNASFAIAISSNVTVSAARARPANGASKAAPRIARRDSAVRSRRRVQAAFLTSIMVFLMDQQPGRTAWPRTLFLDDRLDHDKSDKVCAS